MESKVMKENSQKMEKSIAALEKDLAKVRTGRASLAPFDDIRVEYYGTPTPLNQLATLSVPESRLIVIQPWDTTSISAIEKAIMKSELGMTPVSDGKLIRITVPRLTEERRKDLVRLVRKMGETSKVSVRNIRRDTIDQLRKMEKDKGLSEDESHKLQQEVQKVTDSFIERIGELVEAKEQEIMEI
jgi:ribosome recycling factor